MNMSKIKNLEMSIAKLSLILAICVMFGYAFIDQASAAIVFPQTSTAPFQKTEQTCDYKSKTINRMFFEQKITLDYCTYLQNENGVRYYFFHSDDSNKIAISQVKSANYRQYILRQVQTRVGDTWKFFLSPYSQEEIKVISVSDSQITIIVRNSCPFSSDLYCNFLDGKNIDDFYQTNDGKMEYLFDSALFSTISDSERNNYIAKIFALNRNSLSFLQEKMGFLPPTEKILEITKTSSYGISYTMGSFVVVNNHTSQITAERTNRLAYGNTHEFIHVFLAGLPISWNGFFEEGLADYMSHTEQYGENLPLRCSATGWQEGYVDANGDFVSNSPFVPYSDFNSDPDNQVEIYNSQSRLAYYRTGECFWVFVRDNYGETAIKNITRKMNSLRFNIKPKSGFYHLFLSDIVKPVIGVDLRAMAFDRYRYVEN